MHVVFPTKINPGVWSMVFFVVKLITNVYYPMAKANATCTWDFKEDCFFCFFCTAGSQFLSA